MPNATYRVHVLGRGGRNSAVGVAVKLSAYGSGKTLHVGSVVAAASYRAGVPLNDQQLGITFDYSDRDDVQHTAILAPDHAPDWVTDRERLWNQVELRETRKDAQLARSIIIALPRELDLDQNIRLLHQHVEETFVARGMTADIAIHDKEASDGGTNPHAHILLTMREFDLNGDWASTKNRDWNHPTLVESWRSAWEQTQNAYLEAADIEERVSMRSYADRGINRVPQNHIGPIADLLAQRGDTSYVTERNYHVAQENLVRNILEVMRPTRHWEAALEAEMEQGLIALDDIARMDEISWEEDAERGSALGMDDE